MDVDVVAKLCSAVLYSFQTPGCQYLVPMKWTNLADIELAYLPVFSNLS